MEEVGVIAVAEADIVKEEVVVVMVEEVIAKVVDTVEEVTVAKEADTELLCSGWLLFDVLI